MGRGRKPQRTGRRQFTDFETLKRETEEQKRRERGQVESDSDKDENEDGEFEARKVVNKQGAVGDLPPSASESDSDEEEVKVAGDKKKKSQSSAEGFSNRAPNRTKKMNTLTLESLEISDPKQGLNRKEREELERIEAKKRYQVLQAAGKTEQAQADLARLAIIRKQREEAAKRREEEQKAKEAAAKAKAAARSGRN